MDKRVEEYLERAKNGDAEACYALYGIYREGQFGEERDCVKALEWCEKAAELGYNEAIHFLGCMYYLGDTVKEDHRKAIELWTKDALSNKAFADCSITMDTEVRPAYSKDDKTPEEIVNAMFDNTFNQILYVPIYDAEGNIKQIFRCQMPWNKEDREYFFEKADDQNSFVSVYGRRLNECLKKNSPQSEIREEINKFVNCILCRFCFDGETLLIEE